jgi:two-component system sensor histidine kinase KdpD
MLATAQAETERLARFVENLLDLTRLEGSAIGPKREPVDLADAVGAALRRMQALTAQHRVVTRIPGDLPLLALDFILFEQVLINLLENAARYAPPGTTIEIAAHQDTDVVSLEIRDEGRGIEPDEAERIFDKFYRSRRSRAESAGKGGAGLGLAVCKGFIEAMGGSISAAPRHDRSVKSGSVFRITFPSRLCAPPLTEDETDGE